MHDMRHAIRLFLNTPTYTATAVLALALGIGITVAISSAVYVVLFRPLPFHEPERLVVPVSTNAVRGFDRASVPYADYVDWKGASDVFAHVAVYQPFEVNFAGGDRPERLPALGVTAEYFDVVAAHPIVGRVFVPEDHAAEALAAAVISEGLWKRSFGGAPDVVGREVRIAGSSRTVIGVVDARRASFGETDVWLPITPETLPEDIRTRRDNMIYLGIARLRPGVAIEQGRARVAAIAQRVAREYPESRKGWSSNLLTLRDYLVEPQMRLGLLVLLGAVGFVLLIACVNLANLLLARGAERTREMALRMALGASRTRLLRQLMTESLLLACVGGATGLLLAYWLVDVLIAAAPPDLPMIEEIGIDAVSAAVAVGLTVITALLFGFAPALAASGFTPASTLRQGGRGSGQGARTGRIRDVLVVAEVALAIVLLAGAGLMMRSFDRLLRVDPGVDVDHVVTGRISLQGERYEDYPPRFQFYDRLATALAALPGVQAAAATSFVPAGGGGFGLGRVFLLDGQPEPPATTDHPALWNVVTRDYFRAMGIALKRGRTFTDRDTDSSTPVTVINETMARRVFGQQDPIGRRMRSWRDENVLREIVGVVSDVRYSGLADEDQSLVFVPHAQDTWGALTVVVRTMGDPAIVSDALRREVARLDPNVAVARIERLSLSTAESIAPQRFAATLMGAFAVAAALLAGIGIYGVMAYAVARRGHELGVRLALGATPRGLFTLVVRRGLALTIAGSVVGLAGAVMVGRLIRQLLFGIEPTDPVTLVLVPLLLSLVALTACVIPARRAARAEPLAALRSE